MKLGKIINIGIPIFGGILLVIMVGVTFLQIVLRNFFDFSFNWSDEVALFSQTWLALFGSIWLTKNNHHLNTGLKIHQKLNPKLIELIDGILALIIAGFAAVVAYQSTVSSFISMHTQSLSIPWLKLGYIFVAMPIFMAAVVYYYLKSFFENITHVFKKK
jgi:TRAP-type C4-dicarboxylate transport system permease small subunit